MSIANNNVAKIDVSYSITLILLEVLKKVIIALKKINIIQGSQNLLSFQVFQEQVVYTIFSTKLNIIFFLMSRIVCQHSKNTVKLCLDCFVLNTL